MTKRSVRITAVLLFLLLVLVVAIWIGGQEVRGDDEHFQYLPAIQVNRTVAPGPISTLEPPMKPTKTLIPPPPTFVPVTLMPTETAMATATTTPTATPTETPAMAPTATAASTPTPMPICVVDVPYHVSIDTVWQEGCTYIAVDGIFVDQGITLRIPRGVEVQIGS